jgi:hypothetical protein
MNEDKFKTLWYALFKEASRSDLSEWLEEWGLDFDDLDSIEESLSRKLGFSVDWMRPK